MTPQPLKAFLCEESVRWGVGKTAIIARMSKGQYPGLKVTRHNARVVIVSGDPQWALAATEIRHPELSGLPETEYHHNYKMKRKASQNDLLEAHLRANPNQWLAMPALAQVITPTGIGAAVHSRVADLRKRGMFIEHENDRVGDGPGRPAAVHSRYRFVPDQNLPWTTNKAT